MQWLSALPQERGVDPCKMTPSAIDRRNVTLVAPGNPPLIVEGTSRQRADVAIHLHVASGPVSGAPSFQTCAVFDTINM